MKFTERVKREYNESYCDSTPVAMFISNNGKLRVTHVWVTGIKFLEKFNQLTAAYRAQFWERCSLLWCGGQGEPCRWHKTSGRATQWQEPQAVREFPGQWSSFPINKCVDQYGAPWLGDAFEMFEKMVADVSAFVNSTADVDKEQHLFITCVKGANRQLTSQFRTLFLFVDQ